MSEELENQNTGDMPVEDAQIEESSTSEPTEEIETQPEPEAPQDKKDRVQSRIDELVRQREDWRRQAELLASQQTQNIPSKRDEYPDLPKPRSDQFDTYDDYVDAVADWRSEIKIRKAYEGQVSQSRQTALSNYQQSGEEKYKDWREVFHEKIPISENMAEILLGSDIGIDLGYYLGNNPGEAQKIYNLSPARQAYELGRLESKLMTPKQKTTTNAPASTSPVGGKETPTISPDKMDYEQYKKWREGGGGR